MNDLRTLLIAAACALPACGGLGSPFATTGDLMGSVRSYRTTDGKVAVEVFVNCFCPDSLTGRHVDHCQTHFGSVQWKDPGSHLVIEEAAVIVPRELKCSEDTPILVQSTKVLPTDCTQTVYVAFTGTLSGNSTVALNSISEPCSNDVH